MAEVVAIVEGPTEQTFIRDQLAAHLGNLGITMWAVLPGKSRRQGGVKDWEVASSDILRTLKEGRYCTTMFDYYAMPASWPGRTTSHVVPWQDRASHVEQALIEDIEAKVGEGFDRRQFLPYVQLHEFEALTFSNVGELAAVTRPLLSVGADDLESRFGEILLAAGHPEAINDNYETCPSRRITSLVRPYRKPLHGPIVTGRIGLQTLRDRCDHFASWVGRLEGLGNPN